MNSKLELDPLCYLMKKLVLTKSLRCDCYNVTISMEFQLDFQFNVNNLSVYLFPKYKLDVFSL